MINIANAVKHFKPFKGLERFVTDNSPMILTGLGCVGVGATTVLAVRAGMDAEKVVAQAAGTKNLNRTAGEDYYTSSDFSRKEKFELTWKLYIAPLAGAVVTIGCIVGAQKINARRAATMAGVLALTQDDIKKYKDKVAEKMTGPQHKKMTDELAQEKFEEAYKNGFESVIIPPGEVLCFEPYTGRPFTSNRVALDRAEIRMQKRIQDDDSVSLSVFYDMIGLAHTANSDEYGWNTNAPFELDLKSVLINNETAPAFSVGYIDQPMYRPWEAGSFR